MDKVWLKILLRINACPVIPVYYLAISRSSNNGGMMLKLLRNNKRSNYLRMAGQNVDNFASIR